MKSAKSLLLILMALPVVAHGLELTPQQMANVKLSTAKVIERQAAATIIASGVLRADQQRIFRVAPVVDGLVTDLKVVEHTVVRKGQVLAQKHNNTQKQTQTDYLE